MCLLIACGSHCQTWTDLLNCNMLTGTEQFVHLHTSDNFRPYLRKPSSYSYGLFGNIIFPVLGLCMVVGSSVIKKKKLLSV